MSPKFGNSSISMREVIKTLILHQRSKKVKTKSQKILEANSYVCRSYKGKTGRMGVLYKRNKFINFLSPTWLAGNFEIILSFTLRQTNGFIVHFPTLTLAFDKKFDSAMLVLLILIASLG